MAKALWIAMLLVVIQAVHSYILLTANIDDLRNIGTRVAQSPIGGQVGSIMRRAYDMFNNNLDKPRANRRAGDDDIVLAYQPDVPDETTVSRRRGAGEEHRDGSHERQASDEHEPTETFSALGKSASVYLQKIKKVFDNAQPLIDRPGINQAVQMDR